jgi:hypothetical protein
MTRRRGAPEAQRFDRIPTPDALDGAPELAILVALDHTLELAASALVSAHPELLDPERPYWLRSPPRAVTIAQTLIRRTRGLQRTLRAYREAVETRHRHGVSGNLDDFPF